MGVHLDDRLKLWWTDTKHGGVPELVSDIKGEGRWGKPKPWKQIPTGDKNDAMVDSNLVMDLLLKRDGARRKKDFATADGLLARAVSSPSGGLTLRVHDESRTWRIWTERPPPRKGEIPASYEKLTQERCLEIGKENGWEQNPWKQISTDEENDAMVDTNLVTDLLMQRVLHETKKIFSQRMHCWHKQCPLLQMGAHFVSTTRAGLGEYGRNDLPQGRAKHQLVMKD